MYRPWTSRDDVFCAKGMQNRHKECVDIAYIHHLKDLRSNGPLPPFADTVKDFFVDVGQSVDRKPWSAGRLRTLCQGSLFYSFEVDAMVKAVHHLHLQGHGDLQLDTLSEHDCRALAGEGFFAGCIGTVLWSAFLDSRMPWWQ
jgi:hypothetical protein